MKIARFIAAKLKHKYIWKRIAIERLTEPLHLNIISLFVAIFGGWRAKTAFDLVLRQHNAYAILDAAERCKRCGLKKMAICEFGVASGAGLMNMAFIAAKVTELTGVEIKVFGFDTGSGMPAPLDYRDHPEIYSTGDFQMDAAALKAKLPANAELILGKIGDTVMAFRGRLAKEGYVLGYAVIDVDYYSSTLETLTLFEGPAEIYLPLVHVYLDDVEYIEHNPSAGELLAIDEFNARSPVRRIHEDAFLANRRIFSRANWIKHMRCLHVLDHKERTREKTKTGNITNPYLD